jgi:hypothetical protein
MRLSIPRRKANSCVDGDSGRGRGGSRSVARTLLSMRAEVRRTAAPPRSLLRKLLPLPLHPAARGGRERGTGNGNGNVVRRCRSCGTGAPLVRRAARSGCPTGPRVPPKGGMAHDSRSSCREPTPMCRNPATGGTKKAAPTRGGSGRCPINADAAMPGGRFCAGESVCAARCRVLLSPLSGALHYHGTPFVAQTNMSHELFFGRTGIDAAAATRVLPQAYSRCST